jgi:hypothetical protein
MTTQRMTAVRPSLKHVLSYKFPRAVQYLHQRRYHGALFSQKSLEDTFEDVLRFLYLCSLEPRKILILPGLKDEMLRIFISFTREYKAFCKKYLGRQVNYRPLLVCDREYEQAKADTIRLWREHLKAPLPTDWTFDKIMSKVPASDNEDDLY